MTMKIKYSAVILSLLLFGCGGGGGGSSEPNSAPKPPEKLERTAISVQDLSLTFSEQGIAYPQIHHQVGETEFSISTGKPHDVIAIDSDSGVITILAAGETEVTVVDSSSKYKTSSATFNVVVEKAKNIELELSDIKISTSSKEGVLLPFSGNKGEIKVDFQPEGLVRFDPETDIIVSEGVPGEVEVTLTDLGNRNYLEISKSAKIDIVDIEADILDFSPIIRSYQTGLTFNPIKVSGSETGYIHYELTDQDISNPVITLNEDTGLMTALRVGEATVKATQHLGSEYGYAKKEAIFKVKIDLGERPNLDVKNADILFDNKTLFSPAVNNSVAPVHYEVLSGNDVIEVDDQTGLLRILKVGHAEVKVVDDINKNYAADERLFTVTVNPAIHPGIEDGEVTYTFAEDMKVSPNMKGQLGNLTFSGDTNVVSVAGNKLTLLKSGVAKLKVVDDGGENYQTSTPGFLTVKVLKARQLDFTVSDISTSYAPGQCENAIFTNSVGKVTVLPLTDDDQSVAEYDADNQCFKINRSGVASFNAIAGETDSYLASEPQRLTVVVDPADSRLSVDGNLTRTYTEGKPTVHSPAIGGGTDNLSFKLVEDKSESDVITVNAQSGDITILNSGHAVVEVTDQGDDKYGPASTSFTVNIEKAVNPVTVSYDDVAYSPNGIITPVVENQVGEITFRLYEPDTSPVELLGQGQLSIRSTGTFHVYFDAVETRNYKPVTKLATAYVDLAENPGIDFRNDTFEYAPLKKVTIDLPEAKGTRRYSLQSPTGGWVGYELRVQESTGEISLQNYTQGKLYSLWVGEDANNLYKHLDPQPVSLISITPPTKGNANRDFTISDSLTVMGSSVDSDEPWFDKTEFDIAGATVIHPTREEMTQYGNGVVIPVEVLSSELFGNSGQQYQRTVRLLVQRYEGCASIVNEANLHELMEQKKAVNFYEGKQCENGPTNLILTYTILDKSEINKFDFYDGAWETLQPFVVYRSAKVKSEETGITEERLVEWDRIELNLTRD